MAPPPLSLAAADARWQPHAACAKADPQLFYRPAVPVVRKAAKTLCATCPAAEPCLWAALAAEQAAGYRYGIWGGTTPSRRARIAAGLPPIGLTVAYLAVAASWSPPQSPAEAARRRMGVAA